MLRKLLATTVALGLLGLQIGCYNTYSVSLEELEKVQEGGQTSAVPLKTAEGEEAVVTENTKIGVTSTDGAYYPISPFNFTLTRGQLVAPDEDTLLARDQIATGNVKLVSGTKTALLVAAGVAAIVGAGLAITLTAEEPQEFGQ